MPRCIQHLVAFNRDLTKYHPYWTPRHNRRPPTQGLLPGPLALQAPPRLPEPIVEPIYYLQPTSVPAPSTTPTRTGRKRRAETLCSLTLRLLSLGSPLPPPNDLLDYNPSIRRPPRAQVLTLAKKTSYTPPTTTTVFSALYRYTNKTYNTTGFTSSAIGWAPLRNTTSPTAYTDRCASGR